MIVIVQIFFTGFFINCSLNIYILTIIVMSSMELKNTVGIKVFCSKLVILHCEEWFILESYNGYFTLNICRVWASIHLFLRFAELQQGQGEIMWV